MSRIGRVVGPVVGTVLSLGLVLGATACGGHGDQPPKLGAKDKKAAASLSAALQKGGLTAKDGDCVATRWVGKVGSATMVKDGLLTSALAATSTSKAPSKAVVTAYADAYFDCVDYGKYEAIKFDKARPNVINKTVFAKCANKIDKKDAKQALIDDLLQKTTKVSTKVSHELISCS